MKFFPSYALVKKTCLLIFLCTGCSLFMLKPANATLQQLQIGMAVPEVSLKQVSGETKTLSEISGQKMTAIIFWSTSEKRSEKALTRFQKLYQQYRDQGLTVVAINADGQNVSYSAREKISATIVRLGLTFPVFIDQGLTYFHDIGVIALPTTIIADKDRIITYELSGFPLIGSEEMADYIATVMENKPKSAAVIKKGYYPSKQALRLYDMGKNSLRSGRMADSAEQWFKKAIEADIKFVQPHISLGKFYLERDKMELAKVQFQEALVKEPANVIALCESALLQINSGNYPEGEALLTRARTADEYYTPCYCYGGLAYGKQGKLDDAARMFDEAEKINPSDYNIHIFKGRMFNDVKNQPKAVEAYRKALEMMLAIN